MRSFILKAFVAVPTHYSRESASWPNGGYHSFRRTCVVRCCRISLENVKDRCIRCVSNWLGGHWEPCLTIHNLRHCEYQLIKRAMGSVLLSGCKALIFQKLEKNCYSRSYIWLSTSAVLSLVTVIGWFSAVGQRFTQRKIDTRSSMKWVLWASQPLMWDRMCDKPFT